VKKSDPYRKSEEKKKGSKNFPHRRRRRRNEEIKIEEIDMEINREEEIDNQYTSREIEGKSIEKSTTLTCYTENVYGENHNRQSKERKRRRKNHLYGGSENRNGSENGEIYYGLAIIEEISIEMIHINQINQRK